MMLYVYIIYIYIMYVDHVYVHQCTSLLIMVDHSWWSRPQGT